MAAGNSLERIGRYQILERVGKGGMGILYRGFDPVLDREVAIKLTHADFTQDTEQMRPRFYREARAAAKLNHRNIVTIFEFAEESNVPYIVMEFLRGTSLGVRMSSTPRLTLDDKLHIVSQLCYGLSYAHEQGVVHRDVKPDNIFVLEDGTVKLLDFGIAKLTASNLTLQGDMLGSASYMSPEQVSQSESVDGRADIFSTGVVLYELLTGHKPFEAETPTAVILKILRDPPTPMEKWTSGLPPALCAVVYKALEKDPANRFVTADRMSKELQGIRRSLSARTEQASLDETGFADTMILKEVSEGLRRMREATPGVQRSVPGAVTPSSPAVAPVQVPAAAGSSASMPTWLVPALAAGVLLIAAAAYLTVSARQVAPAASAPGAVTVTGAPTRPPAPPAGASTVAPASTPTSAAGQTTGASGSPTATSAAPAPASTTPPAATMVTVTLTGDYPFAVLEGRRVLSPAKTRHSFKVAAGRSIVLSAPEHFLNQTVRVDGSSREGFTATAPGLGNLRVRSSQEVCDVFIGDRKIGNPPLTIEDIAAGPHTVDISCGGAIVKSESAVVTAGNTATVAIR